MNISKHPCANKCSEFKAEKCKHCLISCPEISDNSSYSEIPNSSDFIAGDVVVLNSTLIFIDRKFNTDELLLVECTTQAGGVGISLYDQGHIMYVDPNEIRHATTLELKEKRRLPAPVTILDMGEVNTLSCHVSPLCQVLNKSYMTDVIDHLVRAHKAQQEVS